MPLLERAKFCAIFSQNLDEFFQVRVAGLSDQLIAKLGRTSPDGKSPGDQLKAIAPRIDLMIKKDGESCKVKNTAEWQLVDDPNGERQSVDASYVCSGAPTMGWPLFGLFAAGALGMTWVARRKLQ